MKYFKTSDIAKAVGLHPNTIRLYEEWGLLPQIPRSPAGYRLFTQDHLDQVKLIRLVLKCTLFGREIKHTAYEIIAAATRTDYIEALSLAVRLETLLHNEHHQAEEAERFLEEWGGRQSDPDSGTCQVSDGAGQTPGDTGGSAAPVSRNEAAKLLDITPDTLRDWERNGLISIPRCSHNGYRIYGTAEINKLRVIRVLRRSNYSNMSILRAVQKLESGSEEGLKEVMNTPDIDEERGYLCFTDTLLTSLNAALEAAAEIICSLKAKTGNKQEDML